MVEDIDFVEPLEERIDEAFSADDSVHDEGHRRRVLRNALVISGEEGGDREVLAASALVHDVHRVAGGEYSSPEECLSKVREVLEKSRFPDSKIDQVIRCVEVHDDYDFADGNRAETKEEKILQDADNLDAIGAIGIARAFAFGGRKNEKFWDGTEKASKNYDPSDHTGTVVQHFHEKLLKLHDNMNTETARKIAEDRHEYMEEFLEKFRSEWKGEK
ncbi:MAG: HD domain-containing protein [Candidatus Nanohalobium sp.]